MSLKARKRTGMSPPWGQQPGGSRLGYPAGLWANIASHIRKKGSGPGGYFNPNLFMGNKILFLQLGWLGRRGPRGVVTFRQERGARMSPLHSPFPSVSPAVVPAPWEPTAGPTPKQALWLEMGLSEWVGKGLTAGDPCRCSGWEQCCRGGLKPSKTWPIHTQAAPLPLGCPCLPWPQRSEQGRDTPWSWFGAAGLDPTLQDLNWGVGRGSVPPVSPGKTLPPLGDPGWCGAGRRAGAGGGEVTSGQQRHGKAFGTVPHARSPFPHNRGSYQQQVLRVVPGGTSSPSPPPTPPLSRSGPRQCRREGVGTIA